jgi:hypothetical protein
MDNEPKQKKIRTESDWLRESAARHERKGEPVWALLYRNEALRLSQRDGSR